MIVGSSDESSTTFHCVVLWYHAQSTVLCVRGSTLNVWSHSSCVPAQILHSYCVIAQLVCFAHFLCSAQLPHSLYSLCAPQDVTSGFQISNV